RGGLERPRQRAPRRRPRARGDDRLRRGHAPSTRRRRAPGSRTPGTPGVRRALLPQSRRGGEPTMSPRFCALLVTLGAAAPARAQMQPCDDCAHLCIWAHQIESATKLRALYTDIDVAFETDSLDELDQATTLAMLAWNSNKDAESPCYKELLEEFK